MDLDVRLLCFWRVVGQFEIVPCAIIASTTLDISCVFIIEEQVMILEPVSIAQVKVDICFLKALMVVFDGHVEDTVVGRGERQGILHFIRNIIPFVAIITEGSRVPFRTPRVSYLDEPLSWDFFGDAEDCVSMTFSETIFMCVKMILASCRCLHNLMIVVVSLELVPESFNVGDGISFFIRVVILFIRTTQEIPDSLLRPSTNGVHVVTMELCEGFLDDSTPK